MKKKGRNRITEGDYLRANRRASRQEEIDLHGRQVSLRPHVHRSERVYDRNRMKKAGIGNDDLPVFS